MQPRQTDCITAVVLYPIAVFSRDVRRRYDRASMPQFRQLPMDTVSARPSFVAEMQTIVLVRELLGQFADRCRRVGNLSEKTYFALSSVRRDRGGN